MAGAPWQTRRLPPKPITVQAADPAVAWIKEWRRLIPPPGVWWRKSAFDLASARRANRLRPWRWLTEPVATFRIWLATGRLSPAERARWNRRAEAAAGADRLLSALDPYQRRAAACFEDRAMVTAGAGSGKTRTMVARAGYAARRLRTPPKAIAFITFTNKATEEIRQRTRERLPGLQGTIHQLARRVLKLVDGRTVQLSPMAEDEGLRLRRIAGWIREEIVRDRGLAADVELRRNARSAAVKDGEPVERHRIPPDGREVKSHGEVVIGTLLHTAGVPFVYEASFPLPAEGAGGAAGADAPPEDLRGYRPDFYLPAPLPEVVLPPHGEESSVPEPGQGVGVDRVEELPRLSRRQDRRRALPDDELRPPHRGRGVHGEDLVDDEPVTEHADRREVLLHGRDRPGVGPDVGGHVERGDVARPRPRASHHPRNCPTARPYAARVLAFAIRPAKNSRNLATAAGPASTITCGRTISPPPAVTTAGSETGYRPDSCGNTR